MSLNHENTQFKIQMVLQQKLYMTCIDIRDLETKGNMLNKAYLSILKETIKSTQLATNLDHSSLKDRINSVITLTLK